MTRTARNCRVIWALCAASVLGLIAAGSVSASIKPANLNTSPTKMMKSYRKIDPSFPAALATDKDVFVVIYATAASSDFYVIARPSTDPAGLARTLDSAVRGTPLAGEPVMYMSGEGYAWADAYVSRSRFGMTESRMRHAVGPIVGKLVRAGLRPHALLCIRTGAKISRKLHVSGHEGRKWFVANVPSSRTDLDFSVSDRLPPMAARLLMISLFGVPAICIVGLPVLFYVARAKRTTPEGRRSLFLTSYFWLAVAVIAAEAPITTSQIASGQFRHMMDLYGRESGFLMLVPALLPWIFVGFSRIIAMVAYRGAGSSSSAKPLSRTSGLWSFPVLFVLFLASKHMLRFVPENSPLARHHFVVVLLAWWFLEHLLGRSRRISAGIPGPRTANDQLLQRLSPVALQFRLALKQVHVVDVPERKVSPTNAVFRGDTLLLRRKIAEQLSPEELDFVAAHEFAHAAGGHRTEACAMLALASLAVIVPAALLVTEPANLSVLNWRIWATAAGLGLLMLDSLWLNIRREEEADRNALNKTNNPGAAVQAILKSSGAMDTHLENPNTSSFDFLAARRLQWLKKHSTDIGVDTDAAFGKVEHSDALTMRANELAARMGVRMKKLQVITPAAGNQLVNAAASFSGGIVVGRGLADSFSSEEIDFVLAHELAHTKRRHVAQRLAGMAVGFVVMVAGIVLMAAPNHFGNLTWSAYGMWATILGGGLLCGSLTWMNRLRELEADRTALRTTRDYPAAASALKKLAAANPLVIPEEMDDYRTHPKTSYRLQSLAREAKKLGLSETA